MAKSEFAYRVRLVSRLVSNIKECGVLEADGYFNSEKNALKFAYTIRDGRNYVYVFDADGFPVHIIGREVA